MSDKTTKKKRKKKKTKKKRLSKHRLNPIAEGELHKAVHKLSKEWAEEEEVKTAAEKKKYYVSGLGPTKTPSEMECITTGFQEIDDVLTGEQDPKTGKIIPGTGKGFPRGRMVEIFGPEAAAKTTLALCVIAQAQQKGELCAFIDVEQALDINYVERVIGVDVQGMFYKQPDSGDHALALAEHYVKKGVSVVVVDSVSALSSLEELTGKRALGDQARMMSKACRKITSYLRPGGTLIIFINQVRYKIGVMFGNPETTSGGNALRFYASVRGRVRKEKVLKKGGEVIGHRIEMEVKKNKVGPQHRKVKFDVKYNKGISIPKLRGKKKRSTDDADLDE